jgi:hypothetical protein
MFLNKMGMPPPAIPACKVLAAINRDGDAAGRNKGALQKTPCAQGRNTRTAEMKKAFKTNLSA